VLEASGGEAALRTLEHDGKIDLLLSDIVMPVSLNGREFAHLARRRKPNLKILFMTGYARNAIGQPGRLDRGRT
jgi:CheY-like chemotaxis protein